MAQGWERRALPEQGKGGRHLHRAGGGGAAEPCPVRRTHLVVVQGQTQLAFVGAQMVLHEVRVLCRETQPVSRSHTPWSLPTVRSQGPLVI